MNSYLFSLPLVAAISILSLAAFLYSPWRTKNPRARYLIISAFGAVTSLAICWAVLVRDIVPSPYMDEIFHIPQAQVYCEGRIYDWDDKITTPPGLYSVPLIIAKGVSVLTQGSMRSAVCSTTSLRLQNLVTLCLLFWVALQCRYKIECLHHRRLSGTEPAMKLSHYSVHTALNISLFPVLFFFSGLYYTDVMSTLMVLVAFNNTLSRLGRKRSSPFSDLWTILLGVGTLFMRQTNIFWVVVFMGGLEAVHSINMLPFKDERSQPPLPSVSAQSKSWMKRSAMGDIADWRLDLVQPLGFVECVLSIGVAAVCNPVQVIGQIWPHITIMGLFAGFVAWNGGVVLGDKSNHVATIHLPQMLYIWPMTALFSWPLALPAVIEVVKWLFRAWNYLTGTRTTNTSPRQPAMAYANSNTLLPAWLQLILRLAAGCCLGCVLVHFNTIVHPFTLADNRHYMFYVFRYTIRRTKLVRLALVPIYVLCSWLCWASLVPNADFVGDRIKVNTDTTPLPPTKAASKDHSSQRKQENQREAQSNPDVDGPVQNLQIAHLHIDATSATEPTNTSTAILLLLATTLSLITAPLVEPRYFIIPWVIWRLYCPAWKAQEHSYTTWSPNLYHTRLLGWFFALGSRLDVRATLETLSLIAWNGLTMSVFLYFPFLWKSEDGTVLDGGRLQRFIW